jgi:FkbM family methyltransferase
MPESGLAVPVLQAGPDRTLQLRHCRTACAETNAMTVTQNAVEVQRAHTVLHASLLLLDAGEPGLALAALERADAGPVHLHQVKRARAIVLAQLDRPLDAARSLLEELALAPDDVEAFQTYLGMLARVPELRGIAQGFLFELLRRLDADAAATAPGLGHPTTLEWAARYVGQVLAHGPAFERAFAALATDGDRALMLDVAAFQALGDQRVRLPFDRDGMLAFMRRAEAEALRRRDLYPAAAANGASIFGRHTVDEWDLAPLGLPFRALTSVEQLAGLVHLGEYDLVRDGARIGPRPGDVAVDGGACYGDTALWLAHRVGPAGRVLSLEFMPAHVEIFRANLALNPELAPRIELVPKALHRQAGLELAFLDGGAGSRLGAGPGPVVTTTIDDLVRERGLERVDFVKLDIEGAELDALAGAAETLRRFRPRLAICAYHRPEDLGVLPAHLHGLGLGYELRLGHFSPLSWDTVLFAEAR